MIDKIRTKFKVTNTIRQLLIADSAVSAIVGSKIYPIEVPEGVEGAWLTYERGQYGVEYTKQGIYNQNCTVVITCASQDYDESQALADAVFQALVKKYNINTNTEQIREIKMKDSVEGKADDLYFQVLEFDIK